MDVIPNLYLSAIQAVPFLVAVLGLYVILWKPLLAYLDEREQVTATAKAEAARLTGEIESRVSQLDEKLAAAKLDIGVNRAAARGEAEAEEAKIIGAARTEADAKVSEAVARIADAQTAASASLQSMATGLSTDIASQVLGREVSA